MSGKQICGILLCIIGGTVLLGLIGVQIGGLFSLMIGGVLVYYGLKKWQEERRLVAGFLLIIGAIFLLSSIPIVLSIIVGGLLTYAGYRMVRSNASGSTDSGSYFAGKNKNISRPGRSLGDPFDEEWEQLMKSSNI